jgi:metallophosphoesterase superfamily enzyme
MVESLYIGGEHLRLLPERALLWSREATLLLADLHLGKDELFRRSGIPVPAGTGQADLDRLTRLIQRHSIRRLVLLGDFVHAPPARGSAFLQQFAQWRAAHRALEFNVVAGNHDKRVARDVVPQIQWLAE